MKMWDAHSFAHGTPVDNPKKSETGSNMLRMPAEYSWLNTLPIAAAIFSYHTGNIQKIAKNRKFADLVIGGTREAGLDMDAFANRIGAMFEQNRESHFECWQSPNLATQRKLEISIARFGDADDLFLVSMVDRTAEAQSRINLRREMLSDSLTGFFNRTGFEEEIETVLTHNGRDAQHRKKYAIILIDLARFSRVNESVGALAGDELIITAAKRLHSRVRDHEILARLGGNEFALFIALDTEDAMLEGIAARLIDAFAEPCQLSDLEIQMECAVAAAVGDMQGDDPTDVLRRAQIALKQAKVTGNFELYSAGGVEMVKRRFSMETDLRHALKRSELQLYYQPLVDLDTGKLSGFEALARWEHDDHGFISPVDFIPVAEESGLIVPLGRWALEQAARTIADWDRRSKREIPFKISVNLSAVQLQRDNVVEAVSSAITGAGIAGERLTLELTESAFVSDPDRTKKILDALKSLDTHLAMDDFGTGYSNLAYLQQLPIDVLKIDRSFVTDMMLDRDKRAIVRAVLSLAHTLGMKTTAEGIESIEVSSALKRLGCAFGQGYYFAKPLTPEDAYAFLVDNSALATN